MSNSVKNTIKTERTRQAEARRVKVAELWARRVTQEAIGRALGVNQSVISRDLKAITARWVKEAIGDVGPIRARELADLDVLEREVAMEWQRNKDIRFVTARLDIKMLRAKLLGLFMPVGIDLTSKGKPIQIIETILPPDLPPQLEDGNPPEPISFTESSIVVDIIPQE